MLKAVVFDMDKLHAQSITYAVPAARVYGITDVRTDGLPELKEKFGIEKIYASIDDMLADDHRPSA